MTDTEQTGLQMRGWIFSLILATALLGTVSMRVNADPRRTNAENCAACHGVDGIAPDSEVPHLAGQNERYLFNQLLAFKKGQRQHKEMRFMARELTIQDMAALAAYYASLPPR
jgi:cytochrome c553